MVVDAEQGVNYANVTWVEPFATDDLEVGLSDLGFDASEAELHALFRLMAAKGASVVRYTDFLVFICDPYYHDVLTKFQRALQHSGTAVNEVIATLNMKDTNSSGIISLRSFDDSLQACGIDLSPVDVERLSFRYDVELNQKVDIEQFFVLLRSLSTSTEESDVVEKSPEEIAVEKTLALLASRIRGMLDDGYPTQDVLTLMSIGSGQLDLKLLQTGAKKLDIDVPRNVARGMLRKIRKCPYTKIGAAWYQL